VLNYKRLDSEAVAGRLMDSLCQKLDGITVFLDTSSLEIGTEWPASIRGHLHRSTVLLVSEEHLSLALRGPLINWKVTTTPLPEKLNANRTELVRSYKFREFKDVI
jgi:hypothetical protein